MNGPELQDAARTSSELQDAARTSSELRRFTLLAVAGTLLMVLMQFGVVPAGMLSTPAGGLILMTPLFLFALRHGNRRPVLLFWFMLVVLAVVPHSSVDPEIREVGTAVGGGFSLFTRYFGGVLNLWEVLLAITLLFMLLHYFGRNREAGRLQLRGGLPFVIFTALILVAIANGLLRISLFAWGTGTPRNVIQSSLPAVYLILSFLLVGQVVRNSVDWRETALLVVKVGVGLVLLTGVVRFIGIMTGQVSTLWHWGLPIVIYDQMIWCYFPIVLLFVTCWLERFRLRLFLPALLGLIFILLSTRRLDYLYIPMVIIAALFLVPVRSTAGGGRALPGPLLLMWRTRGVVVALGVLVAGVIFIAPAISEGVLNAIRSLNVVEYGSSFGGSVRLTEVENLFLNLEYRPLTYVYGYGLGVPWKAIQPIAYGAFSFTEGVLREGSGWYPQFHIPYFSQLYRFGVGGWLVMMGTVLMIFLRHRRIIARALPRDRLLLLPLAATVPIVLAGIGDSVNSYPYVLIGAAWGLLEAHPAVCRGGDR